MQDIFYDPIPDVDAYLSRIGYEGSREPNEQNLHRLVYCHQTSVPFESLDLSLWHHPLNLDTAHLYEKVVEHRRGGYCFELNGLFVCLLRALGYDAFSVHCRLNNPVTRPCVHRGSVIRLNGKRFFCDVGNGGNGAPFAVELSPVRQHRLGEEFWIEECAEGWLELRKVHQTGELKGTEDAVLRFMPMAFMNADFIPGNAVCSAPDHMFSTRHTVALRTAEGYVNLTGSTLSVRHGDETAETTIPEEDLERVLWERFGLRDCEYAIP